VPECLTSMMSQLGAASPALRVVLATASRRSCPSSNQRIAAYTHERPQFACRRRRLHFESHAIGQRLWRHVARGCNVAPGFLRPSKIVLLRIITKFVTNINASRVPLKSLIGKFD
jgi:hypothetical protein